MKYFFLSFFLTICVLHSEPLDKNESAFIQLTNQEFGVFFRKELEKEFPGKFDDIEKGDLEGLFIAFLKRTKDEDFDHDALLDRLRIGNFAHSTSDKPSQGVSGKIIEMKIND